jgi:hypothetical protein
VVTDAPVETLAGAMAATVPGAAASRDGAFRIATYAPVALGSEGAMSVLVGLVSALFRSPERGVRLVKALGAPAASAGSSGDLAWQRAPAKDAAVMAAAARR